MISLPPVQISQSHIPTCIDKSEHLPIDFLAQDRHIRQRIVPPLVAIIKHGTNPIHSLLRRESLFH